MSPKDIFVKDPVINVSVTLPVNPPGSTDVLTADDVWAGLLHQQRYSQEYVPHITHVDITEKTIISETTTSYKRVTTLSQEAYPNTPPLVQDVIVVDRLKIESYTHSNNTLAIATMSVGETDADIYYSLSYERPVEGVNANSAEAEKMRGEFIALARKNIQLCIDLTRKYKAEGKYTNVGRFV
ncbi:hypothetical protein B0J12DRAFT_728895 [Macrophomina phaseolina]|uniref:DUF1857-domain-containing protein n=1 Tax=Macrophomina phaseolina TaxID=35725 RepID=A0ABQ8G8A9_9PEZI|nr:hypothetical protein B0J12DRAFT_728895 [Macrophomina phaseolina]